MGVVCAIYGQVYRGRGDNPDHVIPPEICISVDNKHGRPRRLIVRKWCGVEAVERYDQLTELRKETPRTNYSGPVTRGSPPIRRGRVRFAYVKALASRTGA